MSYYDPKIYNYSNLDEKEKSLLEAILSTTLFSIGNKYCEYSYERECASNCLDRIRYEERIDATMDMVDNFLGDIVELMVRMIDSSDREIEEKDTDSYFYGYNFPDVFKQMEEDRDDCCCDGCDDYDDDDDFGCGNCC